MKKNKYVYLVFAVLLVLSCMQKKEILIQNYQIENRNFNFQNELVYKFNQQVRITNTHEYKLFIYYKSSGKNDSLKIFKNGQIYFRNILLNELDTKVIKINNSDLSLGKFYFEDKKDYRGNCILLINEDNGLIFTEFLNSGFMTEYDTKKFNTVHKKIALRKLGFKNGNFELQYAKMDYPELKE